MNTYIIAEIGVNHGGNVDAAMRLIDAAKAASADAVKFQLFSAEKLKRREIKHLELSKDALLSTRQYARSVGIDWLCTPFDTEALGWLATIHPPYIKLASGAVFNKPLLEAASHCGIPLILSTGMAQLVEVHEAMKIAGSAVYALLHCTSAYPAPVEAANLRSISTLRRTFTCHVGYSDHTTHADCILAAVALGANFIEAHITLDRDQPGPDHEASYEPSAFSSMVARVRILEKILGNGVKMPQPCETETRRIWDHD